MKLEKGCNCILSYTHPMFIKSESKYLPDNFRYVEPDIRKVAYGGLQNGRFYCIVCNRTVKTAHSFLDLDSFDEFHVSPGCLKHRSTGTWAIDYPIEKIEKWYKEQDLKFNAERGDPIAAAAMMLREVYGHDCNDEEW